MCGGGEGNSVVEFASYTKALGSILNTLKRKNKF